MSKLNRVLLSILIVLIGFVCIIIGSTTLVILLMSYPTMIKCTLITICILAVVIAVLGVSQTLKQGK